MAIIESEQAQHHHRKAVTTKVTRKTFSQSKITNRKLTKVGEKSTHLVEMGSQCYAKVVDPFDILWKNVQIAMREAQAQCTSLLNFMKK